MQTQRSSKENGISDTARHDDGVAGGWWHKSSRKGQPKGPAGDENRTTMEKQCIQSVGFAHTPLLEASLQVRSLDWRLEMLETDWPKTQPYCGTVGGKSPNTGSIIF